MGTTKAKQLVLEAPAGSAGASLELFAGGGGMALGIDQAGFRHLAVSEREPRACRTLESNGATALDTDIATTAPTTGTRAAHWPIIEGDCHEVDWTRWRGQVDLLAGGPPCQPWSLGGIHRGVEDDRNLFPEAARALDEVRPRAFFFENVRGISRPAFRPYFEYILAVLAAPHLRRRHGEGWEDHGYRLARAVRRSRDAKSYRVAWQLVNAADYGVPQQRWRVLIVGFRADLDIAWEFPAATHSSDALLWSQMTGTYWEEHNAEPRVPRAAAARLRKVAASGPPTLARWRTLRDALDGLPEPVNDQETKGIFNHRGVPGARLYHGHSGSDLDRPSKSIKAGVHGVPGGEHIVVRPDGSYRYLTVRECARVQGFPDDYRFEGPRTEAMRQIGNAVPVPLARTVAAAIADTLNHPIHALGEQAPRPSRDITNDGNGAQQELQGRVGAA